MIAYIMAKVSKDKRKFMILPLMAGAVLCLSSCVEAYDTPLVRPPQFYSDAPPSSPDDNTQSQIPTTASQPEKKKKAKKSKTSSEALLNAEGNWNLVEETSENDPALAHQRARDKVDPRRRNVMSELSPHFTPDAKSGEDGKMRVLKLQPNGGAAEDDLGLEDGFEVAETSISMPSRKVVKPESSSRINSLFAKESVGLITKAETAEAAEIVAEPEKKPVAADQPAARKAEEKGGFFDKLTSVFSSAEDEIERKPEVQYDKNTSVTSVSIVPEDSSRVSGAGVVLPPQTPARKLDNKSEAEKMPVVVASESAAVKSESGAQDIISVEAQQSGQVHSIGMRAAMHPSKTRLAFDFSGAVKYKVAIDHIRNVLRIKFENTIWEQEEQGSLDDASKMLGSYVVRKQPDGSIIFEVRLREKSAIQDAMILRPGASPHHRVVIDLKSPK